jgi:hypothetical protein
MILAVAIRNPGGLSQAPTPNSSRRPLKSVRLDPEPRGWIGSNSNGCGEGISRPFAEVGDGAPCRSWRGVDGIHLAAGLR